MKAQRKASFRWTWTVYKPLTRVARPYKVVLSVWANLLAPPNQICRFAILLRGRFWPRALRLAPESRLTCRWPRCFCQLQLFQRWITSLWYLLEPAADVKPRPIEVQMDLRNKHDNMFSSTFPLKNTHTLMIKAKNFKVLRSGGLKPFLMIHLCHDSLINQRWLVDKDLQKVCTEISICLFLKL